MISALGNREVVAGLEMLLATAKAGNAGYLVALMLTENAEPSGGWFGAYPYEKEAAEQTAKLADIMARAHLNKQLPERDPSVPADRVVYNVPTSPMCYDFIAWLIEAEMNRIRAGAPAPLKVAFWFGRAAQVGLENPSCREMFQNVIKPSLALIGAVETPDAVDGHYKELFVFRDILNGARSGDVVPRFHAPDQMIEQTRKQFGSPVVITLRESEHYPHRNSDLDVWVAFAEYLKRNGEKVVFVRDTAKAYEQIEGFRTFPAASTNLHWRAALYATAKMNLFVSNGPTTLCFFSDWPYMTFIKPEADGHPYAPSTPSFWRDQNGMEMGEQFPWARDDQRILWTAPTYETLVDAWNDVFVNEAARVAAE